MYGGNSQPTSRQHNSELKKLEKARRHYEKLTKELKSNKRLKRRFKDKNRPKKAKSAYNIFV
jgi:tRNA-dihydrouridine synthase